MNFQSQKLRDHLLESLQALPGSRKFTIHVLISSPRRQSGLFPHSPTLKTRQITRIYQQDLLMLLAEAKIDGPSVFVSAIEAALYLFPASSSSILYISKVDSTGQGQQPPPTRTLVDAFIKFHVHPSTRPTENIRLQLFARAQNQYLFPDSSNFVGKQGLSDVKLCRWWKDVFTRVADSVLAGGVQDQKTALFYLLPGYTELEARSMLRIPFTTPSDTQQPWSYGHPFSSPTASLFGNLPDTRTTLDLPIDIFDLIPSFSDDPKARFLDELASTSQADHSGSPKPGSPSPSKEIYSPPRKRIKTVQDGVKNDSQDDESSSHRPTVRARKASVSTEEFWERMGYRQECSVGAVTGFFVADFTTASAEQRHSVSTLTTSSALGHVPSPTLARIIASLTNLDFGSTEAAINATSLLVESIVGFCAGAGEVGQHGEEDEGSQRQEPEGVIGVEAGTLDSGASASDTGSVYNKHIHAEVTVNNPPWVGRSAAPENPGPTPAPGTSNVHVLQVRKKKRPTAS